MSQKQEIETFWLFIVRSIDRILDCLEEAPEEDRNWRPVETANSLYVLAVHVLGSTEENLLEVLCGEPVGRQRLAEFVTEGTAVEPIRERWLALQARIQESLDQLPPGALEQTCQHPRRGTLTGREVLIVAARHAAEHKGHADLTLDLLLASRGQTPQQRDY